MHKAIPQKCLNILKLSKSILKSCAHSAQDPGNKLLDVLAEPAQARAPLDSMVR